MSIAAMAIAVGVVTACGSATDAVTSSPDTSLASTAPGGGATDDPLDDDTQYPSPRMNDRLRTKLHDAALANSVVRSIGRGSKIRASRTLSWSNDIPPLRLLGGVVTVTFKPAISINADIPYVAYDATEKLSPPYVTYKRHVVGTNVSSITAFMDANGHLVGIIPDSGRGSHITTQDIIGNPTLPPSGGD